MKSLAGEIYRFSRFELDCGRRELRHDGVRLVLNPKAFDLLQFLVANQGAVVSKNELLEAVWPEQFVEENNLSVQVSALRKLLAEYDGADRLIVTVPGKGYSFVAPIETSEESDEIVIEQRTVERFVVEDVPSGALHLPSAPRRRWWVFAGLALILVIGVGLFWWVNARSDLENRINSVAVLPFVYEGGKEDSEYLSDGVAESIISSLSTLPELSVRGRSSAFRFRNAGGDLKKIGAELGVGALVTGRVTEIGDDVSLYAELTDTVRDKVLWSQTYRGRRSELSSLQSSLVVDVSSALRKKLSGNDAVRLKRNYPESSEAYRSYLKGRYYWNKRSIDGLRKSVEHYNRALEADPNFALAYVGLAESYVIFDSYGVAPAHESMPLGKAAALKALEIDDSLSEAYNALALYLNCYEFKRDEAEKKFRRAIELNPNNATAYHWLGLNVLGAQKRFDEAMAALRKAEELDPLSPAIGMNIGAFYSSQRRYDDAEAKFKSVIARNPEFGVGLATFSIVSHEQGNNDLAIDQARQALTIDYDPLVKGYLGKYLASSGRRDEARRILDELKDESEKTYVTNYAFALVHIGLGEKDKALGWLEKEVDERAYWANEFAVSPDLDDLRGEVRFRRLLTRLNLPE